MLSTVILLAAVFLGPSLAILAHDGWFSRQEEPPPRAGPHPRIGRLGQDKEGE